MRWTEAFRENMLSDHLAAAIRSRLSGTLGAPTVPEPKKRQTGRGVRPKGLTDHERDVLTQSERL